MNQELYYLIPFRVSLHSDDNAFVFLPGRLISIETPQAVEVISELQNHSDRILSRERLEAITQPYFPDSQACLAFLQENEMILPIDEKLFSVRSIGLLTDQPERMRPLLDWMRTTLGVEVVMETEVNPTLLSCGAIVGYLDHYNPQPFEFLTILTEPRHYFVQLGYRLDRFFYLDNPFFPAIGNPDHSDAMRSHERKARITQAEHCIDKLLPYYRSGKLPGSPAIRIAEMEYDWIRYCFYRRISRLYGMRHDSFQLDTVNRLWSHDFVTGQSFEAPCRSHGFHPAHNTYYHEADITAALA